MSIRIRGTEDLSANKRAIALLAANEKGDEKYKRLRGIQIEATVMKAQGAFTLKKEAREKIKKKYGIPNNLEGKSSFDAAMSHLIDNTEKTGLIVEGFHNVGLSGTNGNDIVLLEEGVKDYENQFDMDAWGSSPMPPEYTNAINGAGGFNAIFHKEGNLVANNIGMFWGGKNDDKLFINTIRDETCYINTLNEVGHTEIGNHPDDPNWDGFGKEDDYYGIATADYAFAEWYEPEVYEAYAIDMGVPKLPEDEDALGNVIPEEGDYSSFPTTSTGDIAGKIVTMHTEQLKSLKEETEMKSVDELMNYTDVEYGGAYALMEDEVNTFFDAWGNHFGWLPEETPEMFNFSGDSGGTF